MDSLQNIRLRRYVRCIAIANALFFVLYILIGNVPVIKEALGGNHLIKVFFPLYFILALTYLVLAIIFFVRSGASGRGLLHLFFAIANFIIALFWTLSTLMQDTARGGHHFAGLVS